VHIQVGDNYVFCQLASYSHCHFNHAYIMLFSWCNILFIHFRGFEGRRVLSTQKPLQNLNVMDGANRHTRSLEGFNAPAEHRRLTTHLLLNTLVDPILATQQIGTFFYNNEFTDTKEMLEKMPLPVSLREVGSRRFHLVCGR